MRPASIWKTKFLHEKAGILHKKRCWVAINGPHMYTGLTIHSLLWKMFKEWGHDKHLVG